MWFTSRVSACRREFSSHEAASPQISSRVEAPRRLRGSAPQARREYRGARRLASVPEACAEVGEVQRSGTSVAAPDNSALRPPSMKVVVSPLQRPRRRRQEDPARHVHRRAAGSLGASSVCKYAAVHQPADLAPRVRATPWPAARSAQRQAPGAGHQGLRLFGSLPACAHCARRCLTPRSSRAPTACHTGPAGGTRYIFATRARASHRWCRLNSNVRQHRTPSPTPESFVCDRKNLHPLRR